MLVNDTSALPVPNVELSAGARLVRGLLWTVVYVVASLSLVWGSWWAVEEARHQAILRNPETSPILWWILAAIPWLVAGGLLYWLGARRRKWRQAARPTAPSVRTPTL